MMERAVAGLVGLTAPTTEETPDVEPERDSVLEDGPELPAPANEEEPEEPTPVLEEGVGVTPERAAGGEEPSPLKFDIRTPTTAEVEAIIGNPDFALATPGSMGALPDLPSGSRSIRGGTRSTASDVLLTEEELAAKEARKAARKEKKKQKKAERAAKRKP